MLLLCVQDSTTFAWWRLVEGEELACCVGDWEAVDSKNGNGALGIRISFVFHAERRGKFKYEPKPALERLEFPRLRSDL